jgi:hypothetical protein
MIKMKKTLLKKSIDRLNEVQTNARTRTFTQEEIVTYHDEIRDRVMKQTQAFRPYLQYTVEYEVAKSYKYRGETTKMTYKFDENGKCQSINIHRQNANKMPFGGITIKTKFDSYTLAGTLDSQMAIAELLNKVVKLN